MQLIKIILKTIPLPMIISLIGLFQNNLSSQGKAILIVSVLFINYLGISIYYIHKFNLELKKNNELNTHLIQKDTKLQEEAKNKIEASQNESELRANIKNLEESIQSHKSLSALKDEFIHKRRLFLDHDLNELSELLKEYDIYVREHYRFDKFKVLRQEVANLKKEVERIIVKEKRDFDEQKYNIQSNKDN